jgi:selenocysteine lyase/cysteine desulfurase
MVRNIPHIWLCYFFSGPYVKIDMKSGEKDGYDAVFLSPHKFVGGPGTPGILLMNKALYKLNSQPPSMCGGGTVAYVNGFSEDVITAHTIFLIA